MSSPATFNGDTAAEIVGLRGNEAIVFSPVVLPGSTDIGRTFTAASGQTWTQGVTGDVDGDGRDELVLVQTSNQPNLAIQMFAFEWQSGTGWTQTFTGGYGAPWKAIAMGDVDGDGKAEFVAVRNSNFTYQVVILKPSNNWQTLYSVNYTFPWITVQVGNTNADPGNRQEIVTTRDDVLGTFPSLLVFRYTGSSTSLETVQGANFFPSFTSVALGDVNNSGVDTIYMLRPGIYDNTPTVALTIQVLRPWFGRAVQRVGEPDALQDDPHRRSGRRHARRAGGHGGGHVFHLQRSCHQYDQLLAEPRQLQHHHQLRGRERRRPRHSYRAFPERHSRPRLPGTYRPARAPASRCRSPTPAAQAR